MAGDEVFPQFGVQSKAHFLRVMQVGLVRLPNSINEPGTQIRARYKALDLRPMRLIHIYFLIALSVWCTPLFAQKVITVDPKDIQTSPYMHKELLPSLLKRIPATTDTFEKIDGITYEKAVDLYKRDLDPESNLVLWEEMVRAYKVFCKSRCSNMPEQMDVYRTLLLRTMFSEEETLKRSKLSALSLDEARLVMKNYHLAPRPIDVIQSK
jgi:hypothetical protein